MRKDYKNPPEDPKDYAQCFGPKDLPKWVHYLQSRNGEIQKKPQAKQTEKEEVELNDKWITWLKDLHTSLKGQFLDQSMDGSQLDGESQIPVGSLT